MNVHVKIYVFEIRRILLDIFQHNRKPFIKIELPIPMMLSDPLRYTRKLSRQ